MVLLSLAEHRIEDLLKPRKLLVVEPGQRGRLGHLCPNTLHQQVPCRRKLHSAHTTIGSVRHPHDQATTFQSVDGHSGQGRIAGEEFSDAAHGRVTTDQKMPQQFDLRCGQSGVVDDLFPALGDLRNDAQDPVGDLSGEFDPAHFDCHGLTLTAIRGAWSIFEFAQALCWTEG